MTGTQTPKDVVLTYYRRVWEEHDVPAIAQLFADTYRNHAGSRGTLAGPAGIESNYRDLKAAFPDVRFTLDDVLSDGDKVVVRYTMHGTQEGTFQGIAPMGRTVTVPGIGIYAVSGGKISESWVTRDSLALLRQLGADVVVPEAGS